MATGAVDSLDLKGQYKGTAVDVETDPELYRLVIEAFPNAWLEDPDVTDETRPDPRARERARDLGRADPLGGGCARPPVEAAHGEHQAVALRAAQQPVRDVRLVRAGRRAGVRRRPDRAGRGPRPHPVPRLAIPPGHPERHGALAATTTRSCPRGFPRARSSRASPPPASAGCSDRGDPAPSRRGPARDGARIGAFLGEAAVARPRALRHPPARRARRHRGGRTPRCQRARREGADRLQRRPPGAAPGPAAAEDKAGAARGDAVSHLRHSRHPRPDAPQVRGA